MRVRAGEARRNREQRDQVVLVLDAAAVGVEECALYVLAVFLRVEEEGVNAQHQN